MPGRPQPTLPVTPMSDATETMPSNSCPRCNAPVVGFPLSPHRVCEACFAANVAVFLARAHGEVSAYVAGRSDFRPTFVLLDPYHQRIEYREDLGRGHDPADPALSGIDPELRAMLDKLPPSGLRAG